MQRLYINECKMIHQENTNQNKVGLSTVVLDKMDLKPTAKRCIASMYVINKGMPNSWNKNDGRTDRNG